MIHVASLSGSVIDTVIKTENLRTMPVDIFHDTHLSSLLMLLVHGSKFNAHDTPIILDWHDKPLLFTAHFQTAKVKAVCWPFFG